MNLSKISFLLLIALFWSSCGDDDEAMKTCTQSDWTGTYAGTLDCGDGDVEDVTVTITADGTENIVIEYETSSLTAEFDPIPFSNCDLDFTATDGTLTVTVDAALDGDNLTFNEVISTGASSSTCVIEATRN